MLISREGRAFRAAVATACMVQRSPRLGKARIALEITAIAPDRRRRDIDNLAKATNDALQCCGVFDDDSQIDDLRIVRGPVNKADPHVLVRVEAI